MNPVILARLWLKETEITDINAAIRLARSFYAVARVGGSIGVQGREVFTPEQAEVLSLILRGLREIKRTSRRKAS